MLKGEKWDLSLFDKNLCMKKVHVGFITFPFVSLTICHTFDIKLVILRKKGETIQLVLRSIIMFLAVI